MGKAILAIDPSINFPGYAVFDGKNLVEYGVKKTWDGRTKTPDQARLRKILCDIGELCYRYEPETVVVEDYQFRLSDVQNRNKDHIKKMIWSIGVVIVAVPEQYNIVCFKPHEWKGKKSKETTVLEAKTVYQIRGVLNNNAADAIMLGHHFLKGDGNEHLPQRRGVAGPRRGSKQSDSRTLRELVRRSGAVPRSRKGNQKP